MPGSRSVQGAVMVAPVRHGRHPRSKWASTAVKLLDVVVVVILVSTVSIAAIALHQTLSSVKAGIHPSHLGAAKVPPQVGAIDGAVNVLVADTDT